LTGSESLPAGTELILPNKVTNIHNNSGTYRPYDPGVTLGDVGPTLPDAPPPPINADGGCGGAAAIIAVVAIIVIVVMTAGAGGGLAGAISSSVSGAVGGTLGATAGSIAGAMAAGAVTSMAVSAATQLTGMALGVQDGFDWGGVARAGVAGAVTGGLMEGLGVNSFIDSSFGFESEFATNFARAGAQSVASQGINMALGAQKKFSWESVAVAGLGQGINGKLNDSGKISLSAPAQARGEGKPINGWDDFVSNISSADVWKETLSSAVINEGISAAVYRRDFDFAAVAQEAVGGAVREAMVRPVSSTQVEQDVRDVTAPIGVSGLGRQVDGMVNNSLTSVAYPDVNVDGASVSSRAEGVLGERQTASISRATDGMADVDGYLGGGDFGGRLNDYATRLATQDQQIVDDINQWRNETRDVVQAAYRGSIGRYYNEQASVAQQVAWSMIVQEQDRIESAVAFGALIVPSVLSGGLVMSGAVRAIGSEAATFNAFLGASNNPVSGALGYATLRHEASLFAMDLLAGDALGAAGISSLGGATLAVGGRYGNDIVEFASDGWRASGRVLDDFGEGLYRQDLVRLDVAESRSIGPIVVGDLPVVPNRGTSLNPNEIRFSQESVTYLKRGRVDPVTGKSVEPYTYKEMVSNMRANGWVGEPIDVVRMQDGLFTSADNTRILAAREAGIDIRASVRSFDERLPVEMIEQSRFTHKKTGDVAQSWGEAIEFRISRQKKLLKTDQFLGTYDDIKITYPKIKVTNQ